MCISVSADEFLCLHNQSGCRLNACLVRWVAPAVVLALASTLSSTNYSFIKTISGRHPALCQMRKSFGKHTKHNAGSFVIFSLSSPGQTNCRAWLLKQTKRWISQQNSSSCWHLEQRWIPSLVDFFPFGNIAAARRVALAVNVLSQGVHLDSRWEGA